jgi:cysteine desulfurase
VAPADVEKAMTEATVLVSIMHSNNETGVLQPVPAIGALCRKAGVYFHTDAAQSVGKVRVKVEELKVDFATIVAHK